MARFLLPLAALGISAAAGPAVAWDTGYGGPFSYLFRTYGDDMYGPAITPDRPYWHGDAAVPPALRWHDREIEVVDEYGITVATRLPPQPVEFPAPGVVVGESPPPALRRHARRRRLTPVTARRDCPPAIAAVARPPVPAPTEH